MLQFAPGEVRKEAVLKVTIRVRMFLSRQPQLIISIFYWKFPLT